MGVSRYELDAGKIFGAVAYPLLKNHLGNEMIFYTSAAFNTMNFNEFTSNQYLSLRYRHFFEGFVLNKIPLIKQLKWRLVANVNLLYGNLKEQNIIEYDPTTHDDDFLENLNPFHPNIPYIELGYGVENIFISSKQIAIRNVHINQKILLKRFLFHQCKFLLSIQKIL